MSTFFNHLVLLALDCELHPLSIADLFYIFCVSMELYDSRFSSSVGKIYEGLPG